VKVDWNPARGLRVFNEVRQDEDGHDQAAIEHGTIKDFR
jgi:hypothetical protein